MNESELLVRIAVLTTLLRQLADAHRDVLVKCCKSPERSKVLAAAEVALGGEN